MKRWYRAGVLAVCLVLPVVASACGGGSQAGLTNSDIPSALGLQSDPSAFNTVAGGAGAAVALPIKRGVSCPLAFHQVFIPPRRSGEASQGEGVSFTYPEVLTMGYRCPSAADARLASGTVSRGAKAVSGVAEWAEIVSVGDVPNEGYPHDRVYIVVWRQGRALGAVQLVGSDRDARITPAVAESLARKEASEA